MLYRKLRKETQFEKCKDLKDINLYRYDDLIEIINDEELEDGSISSNGTLAYVDKVDKENELLKVTPLDSENSFWIAEHRVKLVERIDDFERVIEFINSKECKNKFEETIEFLEQEHIDHIVFAQGVKEMFEFYDEDNYTCVSGQCLFFENGAIIKIHS